MDVAATGRNATATEETTAQRRILVIFNPAAGGSRPMRFAGVLAALKKLQADVRVVETTAPGHAERIAREAQGIDVIAVGGGDGTVNEVVNGLKDNPHAAAIALGLIPLGTANVLADEIGLARDARVVARALVEGPIRPIHLGLVNGRRFVMMAGAGFDANVVHGVSLGLKKIVGPLAYVWQALVQAFKEDHAPSTVHIDGVPYETVSTVVCNGRRYGGPFIAAPDATLTEDRFHVILMPGRGWFNVARYGAALMMGRISKLADVKLVPGRRVLVNGVGGRPVQADGDIVTTLPAEIAVDPQALKVVFPV